MESPRGWMGGGGTYIQMTSALATSIYDTLKNRTRVQCTLYLKKLWASMLRFWLLEHITANFKSALRIDSSALLSMTFVRS